MPLFNLDDLPAEVGVDFLKAEPQLTLILEHAFIFYQDMISDEHGVWQVLKLLYQQCFILVVDVVLV